MAKLCPITNEKEIYTTCLECKEKKCKMAVRKYKVLIEEDGMEFYIPCKNIEEAKKYIDTIKAFSMAIGNELPKCTLLEQSSNSEWHQWVYDNDMIYITNIDTYCHNVSPNAKDAIEHKKKLLFENNMKGWEQ